MLKLLSLSMDFVMIKVIGGVVEECAVYRAEELEDSLDRCASEAGKAFGSSDLFIEKLIENARHIEVQILGDKFGNLVHLFERDCSVQERHQKVVEIAPAPNLGSSLRDEMLEAAVKLGEVNYQNAGTIEFLVKPETDSFFFIECNPRIQVEHTVTEQVMGVELVEAQFRIARGESSNQWGCMIEKPTRYLNTTSCSRSKHRYY